MDQTDALRTRLRKLLNESIPSGGSATDTNFTDDELNTILSEAGDIYTAASIGWSEKASLLQGDVEKYSTGDESYTMASLKDRLTHALSMAKHFADMSSSSGSVSGSFFLNVAPPEVL
jgi:hypothetical protein